MAIRLATEDDSVAIVNLIATLTGESPIFPAEGYVRNDDLNVITIVDLEARAIARMHYEPSDNKWYFVRLLSPTRGGLLALMKEMGRIGVDIRGLGAKTVRWNLANRPILRRWVQQQLGLPAVTTSPYDEINWSVGKTRLGV